MDASERYRRMTSIFIAVCNLTGTERTRELDKLCRGCSELRAEIELLLTFHDQLVAGSEKKGLRPEGSAD